VIIGDQKTGQVEGVVISANANDGLTVTVNGKPARLAVVDEDGRVHALGEYVAKEAFNVSVNAYRDFLRGNGHLHTHSKPPR